MGFYLNSQAAYTLLKNETRQPYFVDKSRMLEELFPLIKVGNRHICLTRPRRFGKTLMANMIASFFSKSCDTSELFDHLAIATAEEYVRYRNSFDVIHISFNDVPKNCCSYEQYIARIEDRLMEDLRKEYPDVTFGKGDALWDALMTLYMEHPDIRFVFVLDEWDFIFQQDFVTDADKKAYLIFLRSLLKDRPYVCLAYMTGILPIAKYSSGSELNMFKEYDMAPKEKFSVYFGFLNSEVDRLFDIYRQTAAIAKITRKCLAEWYDGYHTAAGVKIYNPRSVVCALTDNQISNYWTSSGPYDEIFFYIRNNIEDVREDLVMMAAGEHIKIKLQGYAATAAELSTRNQIFSAMVVYGLLTYEDGAVFIPNRELMDKFDELLLSNESLGYVHNLTKASERMMKATLSGDTGTMAKILKFAHDTESPIFSYNSEIELSAVVNLVYLAVRDRYRVEREDKAGEGYVDFIFYPERRDMDALILELKIDSTPEDAIEQIRNKNYALRFVGKMGEKPKYTGRVLAVGISYDRKTKEHFCKVEVLY
ncbi:MAG: ATP-binding protein [Acetatifactor sp.]|nr:ATP-binding protein [Acetatifactor sp.]